MREVFANPFTRFPSERSNQPNRTLYKNPKINLAGRRFHGLVALITNACKTWPIGNSRRRPVLSRIPVAGNGIEIPLGANCVGNGWKNEHQRAANRCRDKCIHKSNLRGLLPMRENYCRSRLTCLGKPSSPQTSVRG